MQTIFEYVGAGATVSLVGLCVAMFRQNGKKNNNYKPNGFVKREDCHSAMDSLNTRINDLSGKMEMAIDLLKNKK